MRDRERMRERERDRQTERQALINTGIVGKAEGIISLEKEGAA